MFDPTPDWYERLPPTEAFARLEREELGLWPDISEGEAIGLGWSLLVSDREEEVWARARGVPAFRWSAVGLLHPEIDHAIGEDDPPFGVILYAEDQYGEQEESLDGLAFEEVVLPIVVRYGAYEEQVGVPSPMNHGRLACWATSRKGRRAGWLTARHVADHPAMAAQGTVVDRAPECLDAALVAVGPAGSGSIQGLATPAVGGTVELDLSTPRAATILDVATNLGVQRSSRFPLRFSFNSAGVPGDSGSLVIGTPCGEPMGVYLGAFTSAAGARSGIGLALTQLNYLIDLEVYA